MPALAADEFEQPPIDYSRSTPKNSVVRLQGAFEQGKSLGWDAEQGYLPALLHELKISPATQMLVFSKTSLQRDRISPRTPRAIYFNDDVYVGYCVGGETLEVAAADPQLGAVFYTLDQTEGKAPRLERQTHRCLQCHVVADSTPIPGFLVRSLFTSPSGQPILSEGSHRVDHATPIADRWGGWYVTGTHGEQTHLGNQLIRDRKASRPWPNDDGHNVVDLTGRLRTENYLTPHSDIVALLVFEHQTHVHNLIAQANFAARQAMYYEAALNKALGEPEDHRLESTTRRIASAGDKLVAGLLFAGEAPLTHPIVGTSAFTQEFQQAGPRDSQGRSLRDLDLTTRLFKYPCSYLIYSPAFDALHPAMKSYVGQRFRDILAGQGGAEFAHLSPADRQAIAEILYQTKHDLWSSE
ncbi:hypothetical protein [Lacipirellula parvula]|uniref:hypothetical protein n=1 Tax=Lacipirellula parvula TaxID=2650471 RepID=UPI001E3E0452|nr:hypothetical protein [Lacipirellula parvula]